MTLVASVLQAFEGAPMPDGVRRAAVRLLVSNAARRMSDAPPLDSAFAKAMSARPIAEHAAAANDQHYELPPAFFQQILGPHLKYSSCLYAPGDDLGAAEARAPRSPRPTVRPMRYTHPIEASTSAICTAMTRNCPPAR